MQFQEYQEHLTGLGYGKRLPTAVYVYREDGVSFGDGLDRLVAQVVAVFQIRPEFNVIKFRMDELKVSFLSYPKFMEEGHPALRHAITLDLVRGKVRHTDYADNPNPPILHRKEAFLPADHPKRAEFEALTLAEEAEGLYEKTATIGFKLNWERLLASKGLVIGGHTLEKAEGGRQKAEADSHGIALQAIGKAGNALIKGNPGGWKSRLKALGRIDWSRKNARVWEGRAMIGGKVSKVTTNILLATNVIKQHLGIELSPEEQRVEDAVNRGKPLASLTRGQKMPGGGIEKGITSTSNRSKLARS